jgi:hypothetical protein
MWNCHQEVAAKRGSNGRHEAQADQAEQVSTVVSVEPALGFLRSDKQLRFLSIFFMSNFQSKYFQINKLE